MDHSFPGPPSKSQMWLGSKLLCLLITLVIRPTSLNRGEGLVSAVVVCRLRVRVVAKAKGGGGRMREWAEINRDEVDGKFKPRFPSQITFDMNVCESDSYIKNCIIL